MPSAALEEALVGKGEPLPLLVPRELCRRVAGASLNIKSMMSRKKFLQK